MRTGSYIAHVALRRVFMFTRRYFSRFRYTLSNDTITVKYSINPYERAAIQIALRL